MNNNTSSSNKNHLSIEESPRRRTKSFTSILGLKNTFSLKDHASESRKSSLGSSKSFNNLRRGSKSQDRSSGSGRSGGSGIDSTGGIGDVPRSVSVQSATSSTSTSSFSRGKKAPDSYSNSNNSTSSLSKRNHSHSPLVSSSNISTVSATGSRVLRANTRREQPKGLVDSKFLFPSTRKGSDSGLNNGRQGDYNYFYGFSGRENSSTGGFIASLGLAPLLDESGHQVNLNNRQAHSSSYQLPSSSPETKSIRTPTLMSKEEQQRRTAEILDTLLGPIPVTSTGSNNKFNRRSKSPPTSNRIRSISTPLSPSSHKNYAAPPSRDIPPVPQSQPHIQSQSNEVARRLEQDSPPRSTPMILCETYTFPKPRIMPYLPASSGTSTSNSGTFVVGHQKNISSIDKGKGKEVLEGDMEELSLRGVLRENEESRLERENWRREMGGRKLKKNRSESRKGSESESDSESSWGFRRRNTSVDQTSRSGRRRAGSEAGLLNPSRNQTPGADSPPVAKSFDPFSSLVNKVKSSTSTGRKSSIGSLFDNFSTSPNSRAVSRAQVLSSISPPHLGKLGRQRSNSHLGISQEKYRYIGTKPIIHTRQSPSVDTLFHRPSALHNSKTVVYPGQAISTSSAVAVQPSTVKQIGTATTNNSLVVTPPHLHHLLKKSLSTDESDRSYIPTRRPPELPSIPSFSSRLNRLMLPLSTNVDDSSPPPQPLVVSPSIRAFNREATLSMMLSDKLEAEKEEEVSPSPPSRVLPRARQAGFVPNISSLPSSTSSRNRQLPSTLPNSISVSNKASPLRPSTSTTPRSPAALRLFGNRSSPPEYLNLAAPSVLHKKPSLLHDPTLTPTLGHGTKVDYFPLSSSEFGIKSGGSGSGSGNEEVKTPKTGGSYGSYNSERSSVLRMDDAASFKDLFFKPPQPEFLRNLQQVPSSPHESSSSNVASPLQEAFFGEIIPRPIRFVRPTNVVSHFGEEGDSEVVLVDEDMNEEVVGVKGNQVLEPNDGNILDASEIGRDLSDFDSDRAEEDTTIVLIPELGEKKEEESTSKKSFDDTLPIKNDFDSNRRSSYIDFSIENKYLYPQSSNRNSQDSTSDGNSFIDFSRDEDTSLPSFLDWSPTQSPIVARGHSFIHVDDSDELSESEKVDNPPLFKFHSQPLHQIQTYSKKTSHSNSFPQLSRSTNSEYLTSSISDPSLLLPPSNEIEKASPSTVNSSRFNSPRISSWSSTSQFSGLEQFPHPPISLGYDEETG